MGHERLGILPKTKKWRNIVGEIGSSAFSPIEIQLLAVKTLENVRKQFSYVPFDNGFLAAFRFIVAIAILSKEDNPTNKLEDLGIFVYGNPTPINITRAAHNYVNQNFESYEIGRLAQYAVGDAIITWYQNHSRKNATLFNLPEIPYEIWRNTGTGAGFCELSRLFFAKFTERYLNYFLEREATSVIKTIRERELFKENLRNQLDSISKHAFETSKITQSFSAGWFNKYSKNGIPENNVIENFLIHSFEKMREELHREVDSNGRLS